jgi:hypothetical protein
VETSVSEKHTVSIFSAEVRKLRSGGRIQEKRKEVLVFLLPQKPSTFQLSHLSPEDEG